LYGNSGGALARRARLAQSDYYLVDLSIASQPYACSVHGFTVVKDSYNTIGCSLRVLDENLVSRGLPFELYAEALPARMYHGIDIQLVSAQLDSKHLFKPNSVHPSG